MKLMTGVKIGVGATVVCAGIYTGYRIYKLIEPVLKAAGAAQQAAGTVWNARPKVIFKGLKEPIIDEIEILGGIV